MAPRAPASRIQGTSIIIISVAYLRLDTRARPAATALAGRYRFGAGAAAYPREPQYTARRCTALAAGVAITWSRGERDTPQRLHMVFTPVSPVSV